MPLRMSMKPRRGDAPDRVVSVEHQDWQAKNYPYGPERQMVWSNCATFALTSKRVAPIGRSYERLAAEKDLLGRKLA